MFRPQIRSRHPSHNVLRKHLPRLPFRSIVRLGSTTELEESVNIKRVECNSVDAIKNSSSKIRMKDCFIKAGVRTADFIMGKEGKQNILDFAEEVFPIVAKQAFGSKGKGNTLLKTMDEIVAFLDNKSLNEYVFEKYYNYGLEFRLHITSEGCFYTCRKALKKDCPEDQKWRHHDDTCVWYTEQNPDFKKPNSWNLIVEDCVKALKSIGADVLSFDVKVQSALDKDGRKREEQDYILIECNSASSMSNGTDEISICASKYIEEIPKILKRKHGIL